MFARSIHLLACLALLAPVAGHAQGVVFTGRVTDAATGRPVERARVSIDAFALGAVTRATGEYVIAAPAALRGRTVTLRAQRAGYETATRTARATHDTTRVDLPIVRAASPHVALVDSGAAAPRELRREAPSTLQYRGDLSAKQATDGAYTTRMAVAASPPSGAHDPGYRSRREPWNTEGYDAIDENPFLAAPANPRSTFSIDVDRASYGNVRRFLMGEGRRPPKDAVRIEELVNYFPYDHPEPTGVHPFSVSTEVAPAPWNPEHRLVRIGLQGRRIATDRLPPSNLVFLIDVSGSMQSPDKLPLLKSAFRLLVDQLREQDRVAIVVYAGSAGLVLPSTPGDRKEEIQRAIDALEAGGSTAGGAGIRLAYDVARAGHVRGGNNRVVLATDGDFNVGVSSDAEMVRLIEEKRAQGTFLTVLGFGTGNVKDSKMEKLADHGNGNYAYVDDIAEARKVLVHEMGGTLHTIAKDVKLQVEFNPARVAAWRLIGYENRVLRDEDFDDDAKDAGDMGAGHTVTALYEVIPVGARSATPVRGAGPLRYQRPEERADEARSRELMYVKLRYKQPAGARSMLLDHTVMDRVARSPSADLSFAAAVAAFGMILRESPHKGTATVADVIALARRGQGEDREGYRAEFIRMAETLARIDAAEPGVAVRDW